MLLLHLVMISNKFKLQNSSTQKFFEPFELCAGCFFLIRQHEYLFTSLCSLLCIGFVFHNLKFCMSKNKFSVKEHGSFSWLGDIRDLLCIRLYLSIVLDSRFPKLNEVELVFGKDDFLQANQSNKPKKGEAQYVYTKIPVCITFYRKFELIREF